MNNGDKQMVIRYLQGWNECKGLPRVSSWHTTEKNLMLKLVNGEKRRVAISKVREWSKAW